MALSNEWTEWHLTPEGWKAGECKTDYAATTDTSRETPADRVLSVTFSDYWSSAYSRDQHHTENWRSDDSATVAKLLKEFGPAPSVI